MDNQHVKPPYALPAHDDPLDQADDGSDQGQDDESIMTETTTATGTMQGSPGPADGEQKKKKRKKKKKKKNAQIVPEGAAQIPNTSTGMLFGQSVLD